MRARAAARAAALLTLALAGCHSGEASPAADVEVPEELAGPPPATSASCVAAPVLREPERLLANAADGTEDLLRRLERAIAARDTASVIELLITQDEYERLLYPSFPAAHPPINASFETVWILHIGDSLRGARRLVRVFGGHEVRLANLWFEAPGQECVNFVLDERSRVDVTVDGRRFPDVELFGSVVRVGEQTKILSYPD